MKHLWVKIVIASLITLIVGLAIEHYILAPILGYFTIVATVPLMLFIESLALLIVISIHEKN